ncbi:DEAD/DEAH box helicase [Salinivirga cyanobacteriivorans]
MIQTFAESGLQVDILDAIQELGFEQPTPIQAQTIPFLLNSRQDFIGLAQTGTGKTAAFGLPALHLTDVEDKQTQTLILCPTRELCLQITSDLSKYSKRMRGLNVVPVYGGASIETQIKALKKGAQIVVGTPGRSLDLIKRKKLKPHNINRLVLDEADEMLSMGFKEDLDAILENTPEEKQTLLFSATLSKEIARITKKYMNNPEQVSVNPRNTAAENVSHIYYMVQAKDRYQVLKRLADVNPDIYGIVFCRTRQETKDIAKKLMEDGYNADALHGDLSQAQRDEVMHRFRNRQLQILVATDVAARGIDVNDLTHVINYNLPDDTDAYVHRSGRTGRAGKKGLSIAIVHSREGRRIREVEKVAGVKFTKGTVPGGKEIVTKQLYAFIDKVTQTNVDEKQIQPFMEAIYEKLEPMSREDLIKHFVSAEFNRFLDYYKDSRDINVSESNRKQEKNGPKARKTRTGGGKIKFSRLYINLGTKHKLNPTRLIGLINETLRSRDAEIGKIEILKNFSFFEIEDNLTNKLVDGLIGKKFDGHPILVELSEAKKAGGRNKGDRRPRTKKRR